MFVEGKRTSFSASSYANLSLPGYGHLHSGLGTGAWCAETQDVKQYLQVGNVSYMFLI